MCTRAIVHEPAVCPDGDSPVDGPTNESDHLITVPLLGGGDPGYGKQGNGESTSQLHRGGISRTAIVAASVSCVLLAACEDLASPGDELRDTADLLILPLSAQAPAPQSTSFWVSNARPTVRRISHADQFNTPFLEFEFPEGSLATLAGSPLGANDSVLVTVDPRGGTYGFSLSPANLRFQQGADPTVTFFFGLYGDASVAGSSPTYAGAADYVAALDIWQEVGIDLWRVADGSAATASDVVAATVTSAGEHVLAAPR